MSKINVFKLLCNVSVSQSYVFNLVHLIHITRPSNSISHPYSLGHTRPQTQIQPLGQLLLQGSRMERPFGQTGRRILLCSQPGVTSPVPWSPAPRTKRRHRCGDCTTPLAPGHPEEGDWTGRRVHWADEEECG